jgi:hypothetical protein
MRPLITALLWVALITTAIYFSNHCPEIDPLLHLTLP